MNIKIGIEILVDEKKITIEDLTLKAVFPPHYYNTNLSVSEGDLEFYTGETQSSILTWHVGTINGGYSKIPYLKGNITHNGNYQPDSNVIIISTKIDHYSVLGNRVIKLNILKNKSDSNPFKGGKCSSLISNLEVIF